MGSGTNMGNFKAATNSAFIVYLVHDNDASNGIFLSTRNFDASGGTPTILTGTTPYGGKGYVICRKGGDVGKYMTLASGTASYASGTNTINRLTN